MTQRKAERGHEPPILLVKWYDVTKWLLERVDSFPKNQRFIFGQRIAERRGRAAFVPGTWPSSP